MKTYGDLFTGFGGATMGAVASGLTPLWGNEFDPAIAEVGNFNLCGHIRIGNVLDEDPRNYERVDVFHASPPCTRASVANSSAEVNEDGLKESPLDIALAEKVIEFITVLQPSIVTIENVYAYRMFQSWRGGKKTKGIQQALYDLGYWVNMEHVNMADLGVPQTRKRMIVRAVRDGFVPYMPEPEPWIGWYQAIEDLLPGLPDSQFAPWQLARLPEELRTILVAQGKYGDNLVMAGDVDPSFTVTANSNQTGVRAFLVGKTADKYGDGLRLQDEPCQTIGANEHGSKAFIIDCQNAGDTKRGERGLTIRGQSEPMFTLTSSMGIKRPTRAFIANLQNTSNEATIREHDEPAFCITSSVASRESHTRATTAHGRVVAMTPRCLARFQSIPDSYVLPESRTLASKGIGNAVPPLAYQKIIEGLL